MDSALATPIDAGEHPEVPRFPMDAASFEEARRYLENRCEEALACSGASQGWAWTGPVEDLGWGALLTLEDVQTSRRYSALYVLAGERGQGRFTAWAAEQGDTLAIATAPDCRLEEMLRSRGVEYRVMPAPQWPEYRWVSQFYGDRTTRRTGAHLMNHIDEGLFVLSCIGASEDARRAYAIHPLLQGDAELAAFYDDDEKMRQVSPRVLALAMEYRNSANAYLSHADPLASPKLSPLREVNDMLIADKVQNRIDFERFHLGSHPRSERLAQYFRQWLEALKVDEATYERLAGDIAQRTGRRFQASAGETGLPAPAEEPIAPGPPAQAAAAPVRVENALQFLESVKAEFAERPEVYSRFLDVMKDFKAGALDTPGVVLSVRKLFRGHPHLVQGFNMFLPPGTRVNPEHVEPSPDELAAPSPSLRAAPSAKPAAPTPAPALAPGNADFNADFNGARDFVLQVKQRYAETPETYESFLRLLHDYHQGTKTVWDVHDHVRDLFVDHPDLFEGFVVFLPPGHKAHNP